MTRQPLTSHQREVFNRIVRLYNRLGQHPFPQASIGSLGACYHLRKKGYINLIESSGPRGGVLYDIEVIS